MANYTKDTDFAIKDTYITGNPDKIIKGAEFEVEFDAISTAIATKADTAGPTFTGTATFATTNATTVQIGGVAITATAAELNTLDGITSTTAELNTLDGFTGTVDDLNYAKDLRASGVTAAEFDILDGLTATATEINILDGATITTAELNLLDGVTATTAELNILDGVTSTAAELNLLDGVTATTAELNLLDGVTATTAELNYVDGVTSAIQTQLDAKAPTASPTLTGTVTAADLIITNRQVATDDASGVNIDGNDVTIRGGASTGTGAGGSVLFQTTPADVAGNLVNTFSTVLEVDEAGANVTGNITVSGTVDGRDVATDGTKLDGIEALADVTDTTNVTAAGALMDSELTNETAVKSLDQGVATTDTPTFAGLTTTADVSFGDNDKATFGAGSDLQIYHDASDSIINDNGTGSLKLQTGASTKLEVTSTGIDVTGNVVSDGADIDGAAVFNESGADVDFRIESSQKANMFFLDAGNNRVGVGTGVPDTTLHVTSTTSGGVLTLESTSSNSSAGPNILLYRSSSTPAADDNLGKIIYRGTNSAAEDVDYVSVESVLTSPTDGSEQGKYDIETMVDGTSRSRLRINNSETVFNDGGRDLDFRVESDTQSHMLFVDAGNNHVNIASSTDYGGRLNVVTGDNTTTLALVSTDADASVGPKLVLRRDSASPADNDNAGQILFTAENDAGAETNYGFIRATLEDVTDGTEDGILDIQTITAGSTRSRIKVAGTETIINESSQDLDFRVESDADTHAFFVQGSDGNVGIGTSSPAFVLDVNHASDNGLARFTSGDADAYITLSDVNSSSAYNKIGVITHDMYFNTNNAERMRIDSGGNLLVGKTASGGNTAGFEVRSDGDTLIVRDNNRALFLNRKTSDGNILDFAKDGTSVGSIASVGGSDIKVVFSSDGDQYITGNAASNYLTFSSANAERMRLDSSGHLLVGKSATGLNTVGTELRSAGNVRLTRDGGTVLELNRKTSNGTIQAFYKDAALVGSISITGSATTYNTSSDQRLKENIVDAPSASDEIDAIQVRSFDWKADGSHQKYGMVAQELQDVAPEAVTGDADSDEMMGVDYSKLVPMMLKEIQSLRARVAQLEGEN